ncbi:hypothetical protein [uncultured Oscillibacter sp.]|uniref:hypothetical protein n=1 Tax=uncultured Oscillibacter sp. TaxID=876091 RepID=UPI0026051AD6|nr:hypothetical protein [uncultured Oscillibacter sp.]
MRDYTENELCETVFYLARYAECLEIDKAITVPDERELFHMLLDWAREFTRTFELDGEKDYMTELESQGPKWLTTTFPYMPELDREREAIADFLQFEESTSAIWPWALPADEILQNEELLRKVEKAVSFDSQGSCDTDALYDALDRIVGINPALNEAPAPGPGMSQPGM